MNEAVAHRKVTFKSSLKIPDIANAKKVIAAMAEGVNVLTVGYLHGFCNDTAIRTSNDGFSRSEGMLGQFEAIPTDAENPVIRSGICYLGDFQNVVTDVLKAQAGPDKKGQVTGVSFMFEVKVHRNGAWDVSLIEAPQSLDPLEATRQRLVNRLTPAEHRANEAPPKSKSK
jgi:hypothetical protein